MKKMRTFHVTFGKNMRCHMSVVTTSRERAIELAREEYDIPDSEPVYAVDLTEE